MYVLQWQTASAFTRGLFWYLFTELETTTKITLEWAQKQFVMRVHTLFYILHDIATKKKDDKTIFTHPPRASLAGFTLC